MSGVCTAANSSNWWSQTTNHGGASRSTASRPATAPPRANSSTTRPAGAPSRAGASSAVRSATGSVATGAVAGAVAGGALNRPGAADSTRVSGEARLSREQIVAQARARVSSAMGSVLGSAGDGLRALGRGANNLIQGVSDFVGGTVRGATQLVGGAVGGLTRGASNLVAGGLDLVGAPGAAERVRGAGNTASQFLNNTISGAGDMAGNFISGVGDGAGGLVEGVAVAVSNPVQTVRALATVANAINPVTMISEAVQGRNPLGPAQELVGGVIEGVREEYRRTGQDHGTSGQAGRLTFDVVSTLLTGGSTTSARVSTRVVANSLDDFARASRATAAGGEVANAGRFSRAAGEFVGRRMDGPLAGAAERLTAAAEGGSGALARRSEARIAQNAARGEQRAAQSGAIPGGDGAEALGASRGRANGLRGGLERTENQFRAGGTQKEALLNELPETTRQRVRDLESSGRADDALEVVKRHQVDEAVRGSLDEVSRVDEMYPTQLPADVDPSRVLAQGRRDSLEFMLNDAEMTADNLRRNFRHVVYDSDVTGPVFIQEFGQGARVGRAFSTSAGRRTGITSESEMSGGYFGTVDDARLSRSQIQERNAVRLDNHADRFATFTIPEDTYGVVSRIGEQYGKFGEHAVGGNMQYTFPRVKPSNPEVSVVGRLSARDQAILDGVAGTGYGGEFAPEGQE